MQATKYSAYVLNFISYLTLTIGVLLWSDAYAVATCSSSLSIKTIGNLRALSISPANTSSYGAGGVITCETAQKDASDNRHQIIYPVAGSNSPIRNDKIILFMGGTNSTTQNYTQVTEYAASKGFAVINLSYINSHEIFNCKIYSSLESSASSCYTNSRAENVFGAGTYYSGGTASTINGYDGRTSIATGYNNITKADSIINRTIALLKYLAANPPIGSDATYWNQFLVSSTNSPYGGKYPNWSKFTLSGHSQGGGHAAFLAMNLPSGQRVNRVALMSAPQDRYNNGTTLASWIVAKSATPLTDFWGMRAVYSIGANSGESAETGYGEYVESNWNLLGLASANQSYGIDIVKRKMVPANGTYLVNHNCTAINNTSSTTCANARVAAWNSIFGF